MITRLLILSAVVMLSGCISTAQFSPVEKFDQENQSIMQMNNDRFKAYADGIAACQSEGCRIAIAMAYAGNLGQQQLFKPQTWLEYLGLLLPYGDRALDRLYGGSGGGQGITINRSSDFSISGSGNKQEAESGGMLTANVAPYSTSQRINQDTVSDGGGISGIAPAEVVTVEKPVLWTLPAQ